MNKKIIIGILIAIFLTTGLMLAILIEYKNINKFTGQKTINLQTDLTNKDKSGDSHVNKLNNAAEFVQITTMELQDGKQTFEAFRILNNGMVEWARWNDSGYLLNHSEPFNMGGEIFNKIVTSSSFLNPPKPPPDDGTLGRSASSFEIATLSESEETRFVVISLSTPNDIAVLINEIRRDIKAMPAQPGWYIWTKPYRQTNTSDINLTDNNLTSVVAITLSEAVENGRLIMAVPDENIQEFISGENAHRHTFNAGLKNGNLLFGFLVGGYVKKPNESVKTEYEYIEGELSLNMKAGRYIVNDIWVIGNISEEYLGMKVRVLGQIFESECDEMARENSDFNYDTEQCMILKRIKLKSIELIE